MYNELVKVLMETDFSYGCPCGAEPLCKDKDCVIIQAADAIEELQGRTKVLEKVADKWCEAVPKWISVTERLPSVGKKVLVITIGEGKQYVETDTLLATGEWFNYGNVTHWMPLPEPPKEERA